MRPECRPCSPTPFDEDEGGRSPMLAGINWKTVIATLVILALLGMLAPALRTKITG